MIVALFKKGFGKMRQLAERICLLSLIENRTYRTKQSEKVGINHLRTFLAYGPWFQSSKVREEKRISYLSLDQASSQYPSTFQFDSKISMGLVSYGFNKTKGESNGKRVQK